MSSSVGAPAEMMRRTPLHPLHAELGARFASFAAWELPVYYSSILQEHQAVRTAAGLFDVSHLGHLEVSGPSAGAQLQLLVTQDLLALEPGQACYTSMLNSRGWIMDEMIIYRLELERFRLVVNAANGEKVLAWLRTRLHEPARVEDLRESIGTLALQGPKAADVLGKVSSLMLGTMRRYTLATAAVAGRKAWVARTGYTGEEGCEIFVPSEELAPVWSALLEAGRPEGIRPAGLGARDTLRLEAGLPLGGADLDEKTTPLEAGLDWTVEWRKGPFVGREALERQRREGVTRRLCGFELRGPGVPRAGYPIYTGSGTFVPGTQEAGTKVPDPFSQVGQVTSGTLLEGGRAIGLGYVPPVFSKPGTQILVEVHGRKVEAEIVRIPFYRRKR